MRIGVQLVPASVVVVVVVVVPPVVATVAAVVAAERAAVAAVVAAGALVAAGVCAATASVPSTSAMLTSAVMGNRRGNRSERITEASFPYQMHSGASRVLLLHAGCRQRARGPIAMHRCTAAPRWHVAGGREAHP